DHEAVRHVAREEEERACAGAELPVAAAHRQLAFEDVERLVLAMVDVERRREAWRDHRLDKAEAAVRLVGRRLDGHPAVQEPDRLSLTGPERDGPAGDIHCSCHYDLLIISLECNYCTMVN